jgi:hypothetical protein
VGDHPEAIKEIGKIAAMHRKMIRPVHWPLDLHE